MLTIKIGIPARFQDLVLLEIGFNVEKLLTVIMELFVENGAGLLCLKFRVMIGSVSDLSYGIQPMLTVLSPRSSIPIKF